MHRLTLLLTPLALALLLGACADPSIPSDAPTPASLTVTIAPSEGGPVYIEGALRYLHVSGPDIDVRKQLDPDRPVIITLPDEGSYRLESWARPCDGNCGYLDGATDRCSGTFPVAGEETTAIEITAPVGHPCTMSVNQSSATQ
jgi:hypothetical protein